MIPFFRGSFSESAQPMKGQGGMGRVGLLRKDG